MSDLDRMIQIRFADGSTELRSGWHGTYHDAPSCLSVSLRWRMGVFADVDRDPRATGYRRERVTVYVESEEERDAREGLA